MISARCTVTSGIETIRDRKVQWQSKPAVAPLYRWQQGGASRKQNGQSQAYPKTSNKRVLTCWWSFRRLGTIASINPLYPTFASRRLNTVTNGIQRRQNPWLEQACQDNRTPKLESLCSANRDKTMCGGSAAAQGQFLQFWIAEIVMRYSAPRILLSIMFPVPPRHA